MIWYTTTDTSFLFNLQTLFPFKAVYQWHKIYLSVLHLRCHLGKRIMVNMDGLMMEETLTRHRPTDSKAIGGPHK